MNATFRKNDFIVMKRTIIDNEATIKCINLVECKTTAERQKAIDLLSQAYQLRHDTLRWAKNAYPAIDWHKYTSEKRTKVNRNKVFEAIVNK